MLSEGYIQVQKMQNKYMKNDNPVNTKFFKMNKKEREAHNAKVLMKYGLK